MLRTPYLALSFSACFLVTGMQLFCSQLWDQWLLGRQHGAVPHAPLQAENTPGKPQEAASCWAARGLSVLYCKWASFSTNCFSTKRCHGILMTTDGHNFCFMSNLSPPPPKHHHSSTVLISWEAGERVDSDEWVLPVPHLCYLLLSLDFPYLIQKVLTICKYDGVKQL